MDVAAAGTVCTARLLHEVTGFIEGHWYFRCYVNSTCDSSAIQVHTVPAVAQQNRYCWYNGYCSSTAGGHPFYRRLLLCESRTMQRYWRRSCHWYFQRSNGIAGAVHILQLHQEVAVIAGLSTSGRTTTVIAGTSLHACTGRTTGSSTIHVLQEVTVR